MNAIRATGPRRRVSISPMTEAPIPRPFLPALASGLRASVHVCQSLPQTVIASAPQSRPSRLVCIGNREYQRQHSLPRYAMRAISTAHATAIPRRTFASTIAFPGSALALAGNDDQDLHRSNRHHAPFPCRRSMVRRSLCATAHVTIDSNFGSVPHTSTMFGARLRRQRGRRIVSMVLNRYSLPYNSTCLATGSVFLRLVSQDRGGFIVTRSEADGGAFANLRRFGSASIHRIPHRSPVLESDAYSLVSRLRLYAAVRFGAARWLDDKACYCCNERRSGQRAPNIALCTLAAVARLNG